MGGLHEKPRDFDHFVELTNERTDRRQRKRRRRMKPFQQGELDGLCGLYAIVNALQLIISTPRHDEFWEGIFAALTAATELRVGMGHAIIAGISRKALRQILDDLRDHLRHEHSIDLTIKTPLAGRKRRRSRRAQLACLRRNVQNEHAGVIIGLNYPDKHWSVLREMAVSEHRLADSCEWQQRRKTRGRQLEIGGFAFEAKSVFVMRVARESKKVPNTTTDRE